LLFGNILAGIGNAHFAWPLAAYPSFGGTAMPETQSIEISVLTSTREVIPFTQQTFGRKLPTERFLGLTSAILSAKDEGERSIRLKALWRLWAENDFRLQQAAIIQLYRVTLSAVPERRRDNPTHRELLFELKF
jgi:hypothetical protein